MWMYLFGLATHSCFHLPFLLQVPTEWETDKVKYVEGSEKIDSDEA